jgi:hypothetical protein
VTERIEYGSKSAADNARERNEEYLCPVDDDRRLKTVAYASDTPDRVLEAERLEAEDGRAEREDGPGQVPLTDDERDRLDYTQPRANEMHAQSVKGIARAEGVEDWTSYYDGSLTVDEHRDVMEQAGRESGQRTDATETADEKAGRAARRAKSEQCDHARGHCLNGDPEACEYLTQSCQMSMDDVMNEVLVRHEPDPRPDPDQPEAPTEQRESTELTGKQKGALSRSWNGYHGAMADVEDALETLATNWVQAQQAARAINAIRGTVGQSPLHFDRLEEQQAALLDLAREMAADCHECHADHSDHSHEVTDGERETLPNAVVNGASETPVGTSEETDEAAGSGVDKQDSDDGFSLEKQGTLGGGSTVTEDTQFTLTGEDASEATGPLPKTWERDGSSWIAGPYAVQRDSHDGERWSVRLIGDGHTHTIAQGIRSVQQAEEIAETFTDRVAPDEVSFHSNDSTVPEAAAAAKADATPDSGGLSEFA